MVILLICVFSLAILVLVGVAVYLGLRRPNELLSVSALAAVSSGFVSPSIGFWGIAHLGELQTRAPTDYGFEGLGWIISAIAALLAVIWFGVSRRWYSFAVFAVSALVFSLWLLMAPTF